ncbi:MAG: hypothetical protein WCF18_04675 [Chthoniobacteraceae bacterium]
MFKNLIRSSLLILPLCLHAQTAADYLHGGAQDYIYGKEESAKAKLTEGVRRFPEDPQIRAVLSLIREQQKSSSKQPQSGQDEKQDKQKSESTDGADEKKDDQQQQKDEGNPQKSSAKNEKQESKDGEKTGEKRQEDGESPEQPATKPSGELKANPSQPADQKDAEAEAAADELAASEGKMTERQAKQLLDSLKNEDEKVRLLDPNERKRARRVLRDW